MPRRDVAASVAASVADPTAVSYQELLHQLGGDEQLLAEVASAWARQRPESLDALRRALAESDHVELARLAHKIGGTATALGAHALHLAAKELQLAARDLADPNRIATCAERFVEAFESLTRALSEVPSRPSSNPIRSSPP